MVKGSLLLNGVHMKKLIFLFLSLFFVRILSAQIFYKNGLSCADIQGEKVTLAWDLNEVIFNADYYVLIKHPVMALKMGKLNSKKKAFKQQGKDEGYVFEATINHCKAKKTQKYIDFMAHLMTPDQHVVQILSQVIANGHIHAILSNMGHSIWAQLQMKHQSIAGLFKGHNCVAHKRPNNTWYHKPDADYFQLFVNLNKTDDKLIIFIDDDRYGCHIPAALQNGIDVAIKFTNPQQLKADLITLGIL